MTNPVVKAEREEQRRLFALQAPTRMVGVPAWMNRRTGEPHKNLNQK